MHLTFGKTVRLISEVGAPRAPRTSSVCEFHFPHKLGSSGRSVLNLS